MPREKTKKYHQPGEHIWKPIKEYKIDIRNLEEYPTKENKLESLVNYLRRLKPNQYIIAMTLPSNETNTQPFLDYIEELREYGLDIDKRDSVEYGYKMPEAEKGKSFRELRIFRREIIRKEKIFRRK